MRRVFPTRPRYLSATARILTGTLSFVFVFLALSGNIFSAPTTAALSPAPAEKNWLKPYLIEPYAEYLHVNLSVADLKRTLPSVIKLLEKRGGRSIVPLSNTVSSVVSPYQQLSYKLTSGNADKVLKSLRKIGSVDSLISIPASSIVDMNEIERKLTVLRNESAANREALSHMPGTSALVSELMNRLSLAESTYAQAKGNVLLNMELRESSSR